MRIISPLMLANALRDRRKILKLSQNEMASTVGMKQATVSSFENKPEGTKLSTLFKLLSVLGLEIHIVPKGSKLADKSNWEEEW